MKERATREGSGAAEVLVLRGTAIESRHRVDVAIATAAEPRSESERAAERVFLRSAAKPFQAAAVLASGALDRLGVSDEEIALVAASHSGEPVHVQRIAGLLGKLGLDERALRCGTHPPFDETAGGQTPLHHNCSGKHAGMLALAHHLRVAHESYLDAEGPVQRRILEGVAACCGVQPTEVVVATDGCGAPTFAVPLAAGARAFAVLADPTRGPASPLREALGRVGRAMRAHPHLVAGKRRFDTRLMTAAPRLIAKAGAEGVQGIADRESRSGLLLKVADGGSRAVAPATLEVLIGLGWIDERQATELEDLRRPPVLNHVGKVVGRIEARVELFHIPGRTGDSLALRGARNVTQERRSKETS